MLAEQPHRAQTVLGAQPGVAHDDLVGARALGERRDLLGGLGARADRGVLTNAISAAGKRITDFNEQITRFEDRLFVKEATLRRQWANVQTLLGSLQNQQQWITGQLAGLSNNWAAKSN